MDITYYERRHRETRQMSANLFNRAKAEGSRRARFSVGDAIDWPAAIEYAMENRCNLNSWRTNISATRFCPDDKPAVMAVREFGEYRFSLLVVPVATAATLLVRALHVPSGTETNYTGRPEHYGIADNTPEVPAWMQGTGTQQKYSTTFMLLRAGIHSRDEFTVTPWERGSCFR